MKESEPMDTRHPVEVLAAPMAAAPDTPVGTVVPATLGTRRDFCVAACQALSLGAIAATLQACGGGGGNPNDSGGPPLPALPNITASVVNGAATVNVGGTSLSSTGGAAIVTTSTVGTVLVVRTGAASVSVLTATCTHQQCTINGFENLVFQCPCHGSRFDANGVVQRGPATANLRRFNATITNDAITITA
jgi:nitrite reductase/ring-hydroxylating ferredoxin subunit